MINFFSIFLLFSSVSSSSRAQLVPVTLDTGHAAVVSVHKGVLHGARLHQIHYKHHDLVNKIIEAQKALLDPSDQPAPGLISHTE